MGKGACRRRQPEAFKKYLTQPQVFLQLVLFSIGCPRIFPFLSPWLSPSLKVSVLGAQCNVIVSCGQGHRKGSTLSLDVCLRCHFRGIWQPLWWPLASPPVNMCRHCLSPTYTRTHKTLILTRGIFYNVVIRYSYLGACPRHFNICKSLGGCYCLVFMVDAAQL